MRNDDLYNRGQGGTGDSQAGGTGGFGAAGGMGGAGMGEMSGQQGESTADRARETFEQARDTAREKVHEAGEKAHDFRYNMADKLNSGAQRLRQRASGTTGTEGDGPLHRALDSDAAHRVERGLADGMESTADWIRTADIDSVRSGIERQVREHPGRTLLVALGIGYLIGRAFGGGGEKAKESRASSDMGTTSDGPARTGFGGSSTAHGLH